MTVTALPLPLTEAAGPLPSYPIGQDQPLGNAGITEERTINCQPGRCTAKAATQTATAGALIRDQTRTEDGEALVGWQFNLHRACNGQSTLAPFTIRYDFDWSFTPNVPLLVRGSAREDARLRAFSDDAGTAVPLAAGTSDSGSSSLTLPNVQVRTDKTYGASVASLVTVEMTDTPLVNNEEVSATGTVEPTGLMLDFTDPLAPEFVSTGTQPAAVNPGTNGFLGYVNQEPVKIVAQARDPAINAAGQNIIQSCVKDIIFVTNGQSSVRDPGFDQVAVESGEFTGQGAHAADVTARDHQLNPAAASLSFILDSVAPPSDVGPVPALPSGKNGWYKIPGADWSITCVRDPNNIGASNTAPCDKTEMSKDGGATWTNLGAGETFSRQTDEGSSVQVIVRSTDRANNLGATDASEIIKVDRTLPVIDLPRTTISIYNNGWHNQIPTTLSFVCEDGTVSPCGLIESRVDGGDWLPNPSLTCTTEEAHTVEYAIEDEAGNRVTGTQFIGCDITAPEVPGNLGITSDLYWNPHLNQWFSNVTPVFEWTKPVDPLSNGVASDIQEYEVRLNGVSHKVGTPKFDYSAMKDGLNCVRVRAIDKAGNVGAFTETSCIFVDRVDPELTWNLPKPNTLYANGAAISFGVPISGQPTDWAIVVGDITTGVSIQDPVPAGASASKLDDAALILDIGVPLAPGVGVYEYAPASCNPSGNQEERVDGNCLNPCDNVQVLQITCAWDDDDGSDAITIGKRQVFARVWDNAHNLDLAWQNYTRVDLAAVENVCNQVQYCNNLFTAQFSGTDFLAYILEGRVVDDPLFDDWHVIQTNSLASDTSFTDLIHPTEEGKTYEYRVKTQVVGGGIVDTTTIARIVANHQVGHVSSFPEMESA